MNPIDTLLQLISGKKTYLTAIAIGVLLFGSWQHWWQIPSEVYLGLMAAAVAFLRSAVAKGPDDPTSTSTPPPPAPGLGIKIPMLLAFASIALMIIGCNTTPQKVAYRAAGTTVVSVDTAMNLWGAYVKANHPPVAQELAVENAFEKYQTSMAVALDAGAAYAATSVTNATFLQKASLALQQASSTASQDLTDLENLITSFGVKLQ